MRPWRSTGPGEQGHSTLKPCEVADHRAISPGFRSASSTHSRPSAIGIRTVCPRCAAPQSAVQTRQGTRSLYSVRITDDYRALGRRDGDDMIWLWIGSHAEYDQLLKRWP